MAVKIRLARRGRKKLAMYDVVVADARAPRDGRFIEKLGTYNPNTNPASIDIDADKAFDWVMKGAQPTDTARAILSYKGVMLKKHLQVGVNKGAITQEQADEKFQAWLDGKESQIQGKVDSLAKDKAAKAKAKLEAEAKVKEARAEAIAAKNKVEEEVAEEATEEATEEAASEEAPAAEAATEETPAAEEAPKEEAPAEEEKKDGE
ncbi:MAG: 30S ribosomal protein S16 [bacterium]|nr:30S ribosomal protein S16 [bacterium]